MSFSWKFSKPVSKATLTANGYSLPSGTTDPTYDILKAQIDELRANLDTIDNANLIRCSTNYNARLSSKYATHKYCTTYYSSQYNPTTCSYTYSTRYNSKYGTRYDSNYSTLYSNQGSCSTYHASQNYSQCSTDRGINEASDYGSNLTYDCDYNETSELGADEDGQYQSFNNYKQSSNKDSNRSSYHSSERGSRQAIDYYNDDTSYRDSVQQSNNDTVYSGHNSEYCSNNG